MKHEFNYTAKARAFVLRFPRLNFILIQVNFWIAAYLVLTTIIYLVSKAILTVNNLENPVSFWPSVIIAFSSGIFFGAALGYSDSLIDKHLSKGIRYGFVILIQGLIYYLVFITMLAFTRFILWDFVLLPYFFDGLSPLNNKEVWRYLYYVLLIYTLVMSLVISFINQMNRKFGPGVLLPLLLGRYRNPKEEERIFMFMDLKSSTTHAENLGHIKYSALIRDSFMDINKVLVKHRAEIYQYVGDEIIFSWPVSEGMKKSACVEFYFDCQNEFNLRKDYYTKIYGLVPKFKAGLHSGPVTAVEVGDVKRDIAYHGDTINTASRIQGKCNDYNSDLLISESIEKSLNLTRKYSKETVGMVSLRGKIEPIILFRVQPIHVY